MKKVELKSLAEYFGGRLPAGKIADRDTRLAVVRLYGSLAVAYKGVMDEIEEIRKAIVGDKDADIRKWAALVQKAEDEKAKPAERKKARAEADAMTECVRINKDYQEAVGKLLAEDIEPELRKVSLEQMFEALADCGFPNLDPNIPLAAVAQMFAPVIE